VDWLWAYSWPYADSEPRAREFFGNVAEAIQGGQAFPFDVPYEIGLVRSPRSGDFFVAVLVLRGTPGDDSVDTFNRLKSFLDECGSEGYQDYESVPVRGASLRDSLADYEVVQSFDNASGPPAPERVEDAARIDPKTDDQPMGAKEPASRKRWWRFWK
jgi:hypothetical protein